VGGEVRKDVLDERLLGARCLAGAQKKKAGDQGRKSGPKGGDLGEVGAFLGGDESERGWAGVKKEET